MLGGLSGCLDILGDSESDSELEVIELGTAEGGSTGVLTNIIKAEGIDEEYNADLELVKAPPPEVEQLVVNQGVDYGYMGPTGVTSARLEGNDVSLFGSWLAYHNSIMAQHGSDINSWEDLVGKRLGTVPESEHAFAVTASVAAEMGYDIREDFNLHIGNPNNLYSLTVNGDLSGHLQIIPISIRAMEEEDLKEVYFLPELARNELDREFQQVCLAAYQDKIEENVEKARKLRDIITEGLRYVNGNTEEVLFEHMDAAGYDNEKQVEMAIDKTKQIYPAGWDSDTKSQIQSNIELIQDYGYISEDAPSDIFADI